MSIASPDWKAFGLADDVRPLLSALSAQGDSMALATLVGSVGGSPRQRGSQMLFGSGQVTGYLSGGCVEGDVGRNAEAVLSDGRARRLTYGQGGPIDIQLPCGGGIDVVVERVDGHGDAARKLLEGWRDRKPCLWLSNGDQQACLSAGQDPPPALAPVFQMALGDEAAGAGADGWFRKYTPAPSLVVIGADPPALAIAATGAQVGMETTLIRPLGPMGPPPIPDVRYRRESPSKALKAMCIDQWTAVAAATHDENLDDEAILAAFSGGAGYVGVLGSRRKLAARRERLLKAGLSDVDFQRLRAPIGLNLGGKSPWHIGVSVIAEVIKAGQTDNHDWPPAQ